jgi:PAS domain S-box-containing protein
MNVSFKNKQFIYFLIVVLIPLLSLSIAAVILTRTYVHRFYRQEISVAADSKVLELQNWLNQGKQCVHLIANIQEVQSLAKTIADKKSGFKDKLNHIENDLKYIKSIFPFVNSVSIISANSGKVVFAEPVILKDRIKLHDLSFQKGLESFYISPVYYSVQNMKPVVTISTPVKYEKNITRFVASIEMNWSDLQNIFKKEHLIKSSLDSYLIEPYGFYVTVPNRKDTSPLRTKIDSNILSSIKSNDSSYIEYQGIDGIRYMAEIRKIKSLSLMLITDISMQEINGIIYGIWVVIVAVCLSALFIGITLSKFLSSSLLLPLVKISDAIVAFRNGEYASNLKYESKDEIGVIASTFNEMAISIRNSHKNLELKVEERTSELDVAIERLQKENSERQQAEENAKRQQELFQSIFYNIPVMVTIFDPKISLLSVNKNFEEVIGWTNEEIKTIDLMEKCYPDVEYRTQALDYMQAAVVEWREFIVTTKTGSVIESVWSNIKLSDETQIGIGIDISDRKKWEEKIKASLKEKETLLQEIHHRVKNNMQVISSLLKLQANNIEDEQVKEILKDSQSRVY